MDTQALDILIGMGVMQLLLFGVAWIAVRSAREERQQRQGRSDAQHPSS